MGIAPSAGPTHILFKANEPDHITLPTPKPGAAIVVSGAKKVGDTVIDTGDREHSLSSKCGQLRCHDNRCVLWHKLYFVKHGRPGHKTPDELLAVRQWILEKFPALECFSGFPHHPRCVLAAPHFGIPGKGCTLCGAYSNLKSEVKLIPMTPELEAERERERKLREMAVTMKDDVNDADCDGFSHNERVLNALQDDAHRQIMQRTAKQQTATTGISLEDDERRLTAVNADVADQEVSDDDAECDNYHADDDNPRESDSEDVKRSLTYKRTIELIHQFHHRATPLRAGVDLIPKKRKNNKGSRHESSAHDIVAQSPVINLLLGGLKSRWFQKFESNKLTKEIILETISHIETQTLPAVEMVFSELCPLFAVAPISASASTDTPKPYLPILTEMRGDEEATQQSFLDLVKDCACVIVLSIATLKLQFQNPSWTATTVTDVLGEWATAFVPSRARAYCPRSVKRFREEKAKLKKRQSKDKNPDDVGINVEVWKNILIPAFVCALWCRKPTPIWLPTHRLAQFASDASIDDLKTSLKQWNNTAISSLINLNRTLEGFGIRDAYFPGLPESPLTTASAEALRKTRAEMRESFHGQAFALGSYYIHALKHVISGIRSVGLRHLYPASWLEHLAKFDSAVDRLAPQLRAWIAGVFRCRQWQWDATGINNTAHLKWVASSIIMFTRVIIRDRNRSTSVQPFSDFPTDDGKFWVEELKCCDIGCEHGKQRWEFMAHARRLSDWYTVGALKRKKAKKVAGETSAAWLLYSSGDSTNATCAQQLKQSLDFCIAACRVVCSDLAQATDVNKHRKTVQRCYDKYKYLIDDFVRVNLVLSYKLPDAKKCDDDTQILRKADNACTEFYKVVVSLITPVVNELEKKLPDLDLKKVTDGHKHSGTAFGTRTIFGLWVLRPQILSHLSGKLLEMNNANMAGLKLNLLREIVRRLD